MATVLRPLRDPKIARVLVVLILGAIGSLPLVFLTPPFQVPDEPQHFYRAYELSEFRIRAEVQNGVAGATLPDSLPRLVESSVNTLDGLHYPPTPAPISRTFKLASIPLDSSTRRFIPFPGSAFYSPLPYIPQVLGIALGRMVGLGPLYLLYLGRLFNCLAALGLLGLSVMSMPIAEELVIVVGLLPMSLCLYASLSPDAAIIGCAMVFTSLSLSASTRENWRTWELVIAAAVAAVFCSVKPVYIPLLLMGVIPGLFRSGKAARCIRSHAILLTVALGATSGWLLIAKSTMTSPLGGGHPSIQMNLVMHHPSLLIHAVVHSLGIGDILRLYFQTIGQFGWLTVPIQPHFVYVLPLASFLFAWMGIRATAERSVVMGLWHLALASASAILVMIAMYLMSAAVGLDHVTGVQGRYFIPILVLAGLAAIELVPSHRGAALSSHSFGGIAILILLEIVAMDSTILNTFKVF
jgi:uncharacterized membrane protein